MSPRLPRIPARDLIERRYTILLTQDPEDNGYTVRVPSLPDCNAWGDTLEEAISNAREAIALYLADLAASGEPIPEEAAPTQAIVIDVAA